MIRFDVRLFANTMAKPVIAVSISRDGDTLVSGGNGGFDIWDLTTGERAGFLETKPCRENYGCIVDPLGKWIYTSSPSRGFELLSLFGDGSGEPPGSEYERHVVSFDQTSGGDRLVMSRGGAGANRVECWSVDPSGDFTSEWALVNGKAVDPAEPFLLNMSNRFTNAVVFGAGGKSVITAGSGGSTMSAKTKLVLHSAADGLMMKELGISKTNYQIRLAASPDGAFLYAWDANRMEQWNLSTGGLVQATNAPGKSQFTGLAIHPVGTIVTASNDGKLRLWSQDDLSIINESKLGIKKLNALSISEEGTLAVGGNKGQTAVVVVQP